MKKLTALLLVLVLCLGLVPMASAAQSYNTMQKALLETAMAYYYRGPGVQYDSVNMTIQGKYKGDGADLRETDFASPEDGTVKDICYCVCSSFMFEIYYDAFGYQLAGDPLNCKTFLLEDLPESDPIVVFKYNEKTGENKEMGREAALKKIRSLLQPGDVLLGCENDSGHTQMYMGDYFGDGKEYMIHCWGSKYDIKTGDDPKEMTFKDAHPDGGSIRIQTADELNFSLDGSGTYPLIKYGNYILLRPLKVLKEDQLTASAKARLKYSGISIDRQATHDKFSSVAAGEDVTVTVKIKNNSKEAYKALPVTEKIPENCTYKSCTADGKFADGTISWTLDVPAGETKELTFTVTATGERGSVIHLSQGNVGGIRSNRIPVTIGGKGLTDAQKETLKNITKSRSEIQGKGYDGAQMAEAIYRVLGMDVDIPTLTEVAQGAYTYSEVDGASKKMLQKAEKPNALTFSTQYEMLIPYFHGGTIVKADPKERLLTFAEEQLQPGDIIMMGKDVMGTKPEYRVVVYIGGGRITYLDEKDRLLTDKIAELTKLLTYETFVGLRPTLAYDDITANTAPLAFTDVKAGDWYYTFVRDLVAAGTVNGMSATSYVPGGNLTYGQALKLVTLAVGEKEQAATGAHWASGYVKLAQDKGWVSGEVNADANITRLQFCQIAAKAKGLTEQPEANPFKDTADTGVLAMNKAGVIAGMSADTFQPDGLLTRAQIAKIIWCLGKL